MSVFRVLSLDGGGMMGAFSAAVLAEFERATGKRIVEHFDLIAGTSTGGLIALALAMGKDAASISDFYRDQGSKIFPARSCLKRVRDQLLDFFRPKFSPSGLRGAIEDVVGAKRIQDAQTRLVIPSYDATMGRVYLFKTPHHPAAVVDRDVSAVDVALATSAAPTYFPAHHIAGRGLFIDGGVWANCPAVVGIAEAVSFCGQILADIHMLSISTVNYPFRIGGNVAVGGALDWIKDTKIIETLMYGQAQGAVAAATCTLRDRFHRVDYIAEPRLFRLDDVTRVRELIEIGRGEGAKTKNLAVVSSQFLNGTPIVPPRFL